MSFTHKVKSGDCIDSIAAKYGLFPDTIWKHPDNKSLRDDRTCPNALAVGDIVSVPEKTISPVTKPSEKRHQFRRKGVPAQVNIYVLDQGEPVANAPYILTIEGRLTKGKTDDEGKIKEVIDPKAKQAKLVVNEGPEAREYDLALGNLSPASTVLGIQQRLRNLGFNCKLNDIVDEMTTRAIAAFMSSQGLAGNGELTDEVKQKIETFHDNL